MIIVKTETYTCSLNQKETQTFQDFLHYFHDEGGAKVEEEIVNDVIKLSISYLIDTDCHKNYQTYLTERRTNND